jgi:hypothetical protein
MISRTIPVGNGSLLITTEDFVNGYQAGHLAYMNHGRTALLTDETLRTLMMDKLEDMGHSERYCVGYVVGWIVSLAHNGLKQQEGGQA